ncbi:MAG: hypothetical protein JSW28_04755 [Thermoplasmata archaeon]|nr:MAG: hypothetical protein JSW28_04755 [Thermoplasmata archaeon]
MKRFDFFLIKGVLRKLPVSAVLMLLVLSAFTRQLVIPSSAGPVISGSGWADSFDDDLGVSSLSKVNVSEGDVLLRGYRNDFEDETIGQTPHGWEKFVNKSGASSNNILVNDNPYEPGRSVYQRCNDDGSNYASQKLWKDFDEYFRYIQFELVVKGISVETNRQGFVTIEFYNSTNEVYHVVRYYWDDARSGTPASFWFLTAVDLGFSLPTGSDIGLKLYVNENISEDINNNPDADLDSILANISKVRYGFYQDAGPNWNCWDQVYLDNLGIYRDDFGNLTSTGISLPPDLNWMTLEINKTEPNGDTHLNISILDGDTNESIPGFEDITGSSIDISAIDPITHPNLRLHANFTGTGNATPILHDWSISWFDANAPATPKGLAISNPLNGYSLMLSWQANNEPDLTGYILHYSTDNITFSWLLNVSKDSISFAHFGLSKGITYYYKIAASDDVPNQSPFSEVVKGTPDTDYDGDSIGDIEDPDDDNDGISDLDDPYPLNPLNDMETTVDYINGSVEDIQDRIVDIRLDIDSMNTSLSELGDDIDFFNQTIPVKIDQLSNQLSGVNDSMVTRVSESEVNILSYLAKMNSSLSDDIQNLLVSITEDITGMNASLSEELTNLLYTMTSEHDALQEWLDIVLSEIDANLTATNDTLHQQLDDLDSTVATFYNNLTDDIKDIDDDLREHDQKTGENHSYQIDLLNQLIDGQIEKEKIQELRTVLVNLAGNLSVHNETIADDLMGVVNDIDEFQMDTDRQLKDINTTLEELAKLEEILGDLEELDQNLETAEENVQDSIDERSTRDEDSERFFILELLLIIVLAFLVINMIITLTVAVKKESPLQAHMPQSIPQRQEIHPGFVTQDSKSVKDAVPEKKTPPRPPSNLQEEV